MISTQKLYTLLYNEGSKFETSIMNSRSVKKFITGLIFELSTLPNGRLVSIVSAESNEEQTAILVDRLIFDCKYILDRVVQSYPKRNEEYNFMHNVLSKILSIFGIIADNLQLPTIETINSNSEPYTFIAEPLSNLTFFALLRGADWVNNRRPGNDQIGMIHVSHPENNINLPQFIKSLLMPHQILYGTTSNIQKYLGYEHCKIWYSASIHRLFINTAIEIRRYHTSVALKLTPEVLTLLNELTMNSKYPYDTKILYIVLWIINIIYYRYGNSETLNNQYIDAAYALAKKVIPKHRNYRCCVAALVV